jgi:hypothetical protein
MNHPFSPGASMLALVVWAGLAGCAVPRFVVPEAPRLDDAKSSPPKVPEAKPVSPSLDLGALREESAAAPGAGISVDARVAILPIRTPDAIGTGGLVRGLTDWAQSLVAPGENAEGTRPGPALPPDAAMLIDGLARAGLRQFVRQTNTAGNLIEDRLMRGLLTAGVTRLLGPDELGAISARKVGNRDGQVTWQGSLDELVRVEPVTDADLLVAIRLDRLSATETPIPVEWVFDPAEMSAYRKAFQQFERETGAAESAVERSRVALTSACETEKRRYLGDGGEFAAAGQAPTIGDRGVAACEEMAASLATRSEGWARLRRTATRPEDLLREAEGRREERKLPVFEAAAQVRLISARDLRLLWLGDLSLRTASAAEAADRISARVLAEIARLREVGGPAPAPVWPRR